MKLPHERPTFLLMPTRGLLLLFLLLSLAGCGPRTKHPDLIVLQTGRIFGNIYPLEAKSIAPLQHYPYLAGYVKQVRAEAAKTGSQVLLIDSGDSLGGSFASYATQSANMVDFFNLLQYDAIMLGNLDASTDPSVLARLKMPVLVPFRTSDGSSPLAATHTALTLQKGGISLRLLANFYGDTAKEAFPQRFPMWFGPTWQRVEPVRDYTPFLKEPHPPNTLPITLFHWMKFEPSPTPPAFAQTLRDAGVDAILAHRIYNSGVRDTWERSPLEQWPLPVSENILRQNGGFTIARINLSHRSSGWVTTSPPVLVHMTANTAPADPDIIAAINRLAPALKAADEPLGPLNKLLDESEILPAYMKMLAGAFKADAVLLSAASVRSPLPAGTLTSNKLFASIPWNNPLVILQLNEDQLARASAIRGHVVLRKKSLPSPARLVTSLFFARILQDQLGLPDTALETIPDSLEFENAKAMVKAQPAALANASIPEGWSYVPAP
jgi:hypothetical protein